jgi:hypothetical protein
VQLNVLLLSYSLYTFEFLVRKRNGWDTTRVSARFPAKTSRDEGAKMIDSVVNLLFRCRHKRLTRPVTPVRRGGLPHGETYVACLDCGKQFKYDTREMRVGKPLPATPALTCTKSIA